MKLYLLLILLALLGGGCASVISPDVLKKVEPDITPADVRADPQRYRGRMVLWAGIIVSVEYLKEHTLIEVLHTGLTATHRPNLDVDSSQGRFLIEAQGFIDRMVYSPKRGITVAGTIKGVRAKRLGKMSYTYPVVSPVELILVDPPQELYPAPPPWWYYYPPYYPYHYPPPPY